MSARMLVTGFQPFGGATMNPAWEAVRRLPDTIGGAEVVKVEIPVVFGRASAAVDAAIEANRPDIVLCVGQAGGRCKITPEFVGINYIDARIPDNEGNQPLAKRVVEDGPDAYFSTLPVRAMAQAMPAYLRPSRSRPGPTSATTSCMPSCIRSRPGFQAPEVPFCTSPMQPSRRRNFPQTRRACPSRPWPRALRSPSLRRSSIWRTWR